MWNEDRPLVQALLNYSNKNPISFHVPGHKNGHLSRLPESMKKALAYDVTELSGLDDLHAPEGVIKEAQDKLSSLYQSDASFFLVNGSTVGNLAMLHAACRAGDTILVQRNAHKSVFHAIELIGADPVFITPDWDEQVKAAGMLTVQQIAAALKIYPESKAVVLTYPTYYGTAGKEMAECIALCHKQQIPVIVDEAHGAHFIIGEPFPKSALELGADMAVQSAHKTLPAMTMASFLHVRSQFIDSNKVAHYLHMLQSSSPSYLLMSSLDDARSFAERYTEEDKAYFMDWRQKFLNELHSIPSLQAVEMDDPLKISLRTKGYSGYQFQTHLEAEGVYAELADPYQVLFILPLLTIQDEYSMKTILVKIQKALHKLLAERPTIQNSNQVYLPSLITRPYFLSHQLRDKKQEWLSYEKAIGAVAASAVIPYPPGIPLVMAGEIITREHIEVIEELAAFPAAFQGGIHTARQEIAAIQLDKGE